MNKTPQFCIEEFSGEVYPTLRHAQGSALDGFAKMIARTINMMIQDGTLTIDDGVIIPNKTGRGK